MKKLRSSLSSVCFLLLLFVFPSTPRVTQAGKPIPYDFDGCVLEGFTISKDGNDFHPFNPFSKERYEGKRIQMRGLLYPGDYFRVDQSSLKVVGPCPKPLDEKMSKGLALAYFSKSIDRDHENKLTQALKAIHRAIELDPQNCHFYRTRSEYLRRMHRAQEAVKDLEKGYLLGCPPEDPSEK